VQEPHDAPAPAITPSLPMAENSEIARYVFSLLHLGQAMDASASDIARRVSKRVPHSEQQYSYKGIVLPPIPIVIPFDFTVKAVLLPNEPQRPSHLREGRQHAVKLFVGVGRHVTGAQQRRLGWHRR